MRTRSKIKILSAILLLGFLTFIIAFSSQGEALQLSKSWIDFDALQAAPSLSDGLIWYQDNTDSFYFTNGSSTFPIVSLTEAGNLYLDGNLSVYDLAVRSGQSISLAGATFENEGHYTSIDTNWIIHEDEQPSAFMGVYAHNESVWTDAHIVLEAGNSTFNLVKNSEDNPDLPEALTLVNEGGNLMLYVQHGEEIMFHHYTSLTEDEYGNIEEIIGDEMLMALNDTGLVLTIGDFIVDGIELEPYTRYSVSTGVLSGGMISINATDNTLLDVTAGEAIIANYTDVYAPVINLVTWENQTVYPALAGVRSKWLGIRRNSTDGSAEFVFETYFTPEEMRTTVILGRCWGAGTDTITGKGQYSTPAYGLAKTVEDLINTFGSLNRDGNVFLANGANLLLDKSEGHSFRFSAAFATNPLSPNMHTDIQQLAITSYKYHLQNSTTTTTEVDIEPNFYDVDGVKTAVGSGQVTVQRVYFFPVSGTVHVVYGQAEYDSLEHAMDNAQSEAVLLNNDILSGSILRAWLILEQGATDLSDIDKVWVIAASNIGTGGGGTGGVSVHYSLSDLEWGVSGHYGDLDIVGDFSVGTSDFFVDDSLGRVGIGTANPATMLEIKKIGGSASLRLTGSDAYVIHSVQSEYDINYIRPSGYAIIDIRGIPLDKSSPAQYRFGIASGSTGANTISLYEPNSTLTQAQIASSGSNTFFNKYGGNFGIGTSSPTQKLDVNGSVIISGDLFVGDISSSANLTFGVENGNDIFLNLGDDAGVSELVFKDSGGFIVLEIDSDGNFDTLGYVEASSVNVVDGGNVTADWFIGNVDGVISDPEVLYRNGSVGLTGDWDAGAYTITAKGLEIYGSGGRVLTIETTDDKQATINLKSNGIQKGLMGYNEVNNLVVITHKESGASKNDLALLIKEGMVGIGVIPTTTLDVANSSGVASFKLTGQFANVIHQIQTEYDITYTRTSAGTAIMDFMAKPIDEGSNAQYRFGIASGSTGENIIYLYEPNGSSIQSQISSSGLNTYFNRYGGNFGIGTSSPVQRLDVNGSIVADGLDVLEIANTLGDLKIQPDVTGNVVLFGDTDVGNDENSQMFYLWRKAPEGNDYIRIFINNAQRAYIHGSPSGGMYMQGQTDMALNSVTEDVLLQVGDDAGVKKIRFMDSGSNTIGYVDSDGNAQFDGSLQVDGDMQLDGTMRADGNATIAGTLGVGLSTPIERLVVDVAANSFGGLQVVNSDVSSGSQAGLILRTDHNLTGKLNDAGTYGWQLTARGDAYVAASEREGLMLEYRDDTTWRGVAFWQHDTGFMGLGTNEPAVKLDVVGSVLVSGAMGIDSISEFTGSAGVTVENVLLENGDIFLLSDNKVQFREAGVYIQSFESGHLDLYATDTIDLNAGDIRLHGAVLFSPTEVTISGGAITISRSYHRVDTEGDAATDNLDTISSGYDGQILILRTEANARDVTIRDEVDNIKLVGGADFTLNRMYDKITFVYDTHGGGFWVELSRSDID